MPEPPIVIIDPFFDGEDPTAPKRKFLQDSPYQDPKSEVMELGAVAGMPVTRFMPSIRGLSTSLIPHANQGGVPIGVSPNIMAGERITIDEHLHKDAVQVPLGQLTDDMVQAALADAAQLTPAVRDLPTHRLRSAAAMHVLAARAAENISQISLPAPAGPVIYQQETQPMFVAPNAPAQQHAYQGPQTAQPSRRASPLSAFTTQPRNPNGPQLVDMTSNPLGATPPPGVPVTFELQLESRNGHYSHYEDCEYAAVIPIPNDPKIRPGFLVLVTDMRSGKRRFALPVGDSAPPMACQINGAQQVYLVHSTGIQYVHGGYEYCVIVVDNEGQAEQPA